MQAACYTRRMAREFVAVDLGGTNVRAARYHDDVTPVARAQTLTGAGEGIQAVEQRLLDTIRAVMPSRAEDVTAIGIGAPGPLNPRTGILVAPANLPLKNYPMKDVVEREFGRPVFVGNDANVAGLAEWKFGAARGIDDVLYLTISTGIGSGMIVGGRMLVGREGLAAEAGHIVVLPEGPACGCGLRGHLEAMANGRAIARAAQERVRSGADSRLLELAGGKVEDITAITVGQAAAQGDPAAIEVLREAGTWIGRAVADLLHLFNPGIVIIGGGISKTGELLLEPLRQAMRRQCLSPAYWQDVPVVQAALGDDVGLLGALALALEETHATTANLSLPA